MEYSFGKTRWGFPTFAGDSGIFKVLPEFVEDDGAAEGDDRPAPPQLLLSSLL